MGPESDNLDLAKYVDVFTRWWWVILLVPAIAGVLAYYQASTQTPLYRASTDILVQQARSGLIGPANTQANADLANTYAKLAETTPLLEQLRGELALTELPKIKASGRGSILQISADHRNPAAARDLANNLADLLILDIQTSKMAEIARLEALAASQGISVDRDILQAQVANIDSLRIIEPAMIPDSPFSPRPVRSTILGVTFGLLFGTVIVFVLEYFSNRLRSVEQIKDVFDATGSESVPLGVIFNWKAKEIGRSNLVSRDQPHGIYAEMFRQIRSVFQFRANNAESGHKAFLITSAIPVEGKTTVSTNLAVVLAQAGNRVILVDGDLRRPALAGIFGLSEVAGKNGNGLSCLLSDGRRPVHKELMDVGIPGLKVLTAGKLLPNPADVLARPRAKAIFDELRKQCDVMLIDSPPIMAAADSLILADYADSVIMTVSMRGTKINGFIDAIDQIQRTGTPVLGYVLNKAQGGRMGYGRYYYKYYSAPLDEGKNGKKPMRRI